MIYRQTTCKKYVTNCLSYDDANDPEHQLNTAHVNNMGFIWDESPTWKNQADSWSCNGKLARNRYLGSGELLLCD